MSKQILANKDQSVYLIKEIFTSPLIMGRPANFLDVTDISAIFRVMPRRGYCLIQSFPFPNLELKYVS